MRRTAKTLFLGPLVETPGGYGFQYLQAGHAPLMLEYKTRKEARTQRNTTNEANPDVFVLTDTLFKAVTAALQEERMLTEQKHTVKLIAHEGGEDD